MSSSRSFASLSRRTLSTKATIISSKAKRSSAYDRDFEQKLVDNNVYPEGFEHADRTTPEPNNLDGIIQGLSNPRASLSPSLFPAAAFKDFKQVNSRVISKGNVMAKILPKILGNADIPSKDNLVFSNLDLITNKTTVNAMPDLFDGSHSKDLNKIVRQDLSKMIIPITYGMAPVAPNFFLEVKAPRGAADVAKRQACLDGAIGARGMLSLQNYGEDGPVYDGNAHTYSSTYYNGLLQLYAHHVTGPTNEGEQPEYHMTQLRTFGMTDTRETFIAGATAFRNARDLARQQRDTFIQEANARAAQAQTVDTREHLSKVHGGSHTHGHVYRSESTAWQDSHDDLQQYIAETYDEAHTTPTHRYTSDESQDPGQDPALGTDDPSISFMSSFTSGFSTDNTRPKRSRQSSSSPTQGSRSLKSRSRLTSQKSALTPADVADPKAPNSDVSYWVKAYDRKGKVCFRNPEGQEVETEVVDWEERTVDGRQCYGWQSPKSGRVLWTMEQPSRLVQERRGKGK